jgi:hypothetical protein
LEGGSWSKEQAKEKTTKQKIPYPNNKAKRAGVVSQVCVFGRIDLFF